MLPLLPTPMVVAVHRHRPFIFLILRSMADWVTNPSFITIDSKLLTFNTPLISISQNEWYFSQFLAQVCSHYLRLCIDRWIDGLFFNQNSSESKFHDFDHIESWEIAVLPVMPLVERRRRRRGGREITNRILSQSTTTTHLHLKTMKTFSSYYEIPQVTTFHSATI